jgi:hypothetical protein
LRFAAFLRVVLRFGAAFLRVVLRFGAAFLAVVLRRRRAGMQRHLLSLLRSETLLNFFFVYVLFLNVIMKITTLYYIFFYSVIQQNKNVTVDK